MVNSLTAICLLAGTENYLSVDFLRRNGIFFAIGELNTTHKQHHHGELPPTPLGCSFPFLVPFFLGPQERNSLPFLLIPQ